jgi:hypothetical protein
MSDLPKSPTAGTEVVKQGSEIWSAFRMGERPVDTHLSCAFRGSDLGLGVAEQGRAD